MLFNVFVNRLGRCRALADIELQQPRLAAERADRLGHGIGFFAPAAAMHDDIVAVARQA